MTATAGPRADLPPHAAPRAPLRTKLFWVALLYLSQGFPFGLVNNMLPVYLRTEHASLEIIGKVLGVAGLAWTLKFLWAWVVDRYGTLRRWILACQLGIAALVLALIPADPAAAPLTIALVIAGIALLSATQDIAIDAYSINLLDERELGPANGLRVTAYRVALILAGGLVVRLAGVSSWAVAFVASAAVMALLAALTATVPSAVKAPPPASLWRSFEEPLRGLVRLPGFWAVLLFVVVFKFGDYALVPMIPPFWVDRGLSTQQIGDMQGTVGMLATIGGAMAGGWLTARLGTFRALWALGLVQALSNLGYYVAAVSAPSLALAYGVVVVEQFTGGLGTAAFLAFLMSICDRRYAASQYALLSAAFGLGRSLVTFISGDLASRLGYADYFLFTFALAFPAFLLLPWVRRLRTARLTDAERASLA
ncbi:MAG TPA: MFS transporter [Gemmatimonadaceae bacterium]|nr:MFS transporter [Gemmatimonadaceae bacterium]